MEWFPKQSAILYGTRATNKEPLQPGYCVVAQDLEGAYKHYGVWPVLGLRELRDGLPEEDRCLYAMQTLASPTHLYFDLERKEDQVAEPVQQTALRAVCEVWRAARAVLEDDLRQRVTGVLLLQAASPGKCSFHLHVRCEQPWAHVGHVGLVARCVYDRLDATTREWVDTGVYTMNRCFRLAGCHKRDKPLSSAFVAVPATGCDEALDAYLAAPISEDDMVAWSASVECPQAACVRFPFARAPAKMPGWDARGLCEAYDQPTAKWTQQADIPWELYPTREVRQALGAKVSGRAGEGATHFWKHATYGQYHRVPDPAALFAAVSRSGRPSLLNEVVADTEPRHPWLDLDHLRAAAEDGSHEGVEYLLGQVLEAVTPLLVDPSCVLTASLAPHAKDMDAADLADALSVERPGAAVFDGCHLRFTRAVTTHGEHAALVAHVAQHLRLKHVVDSNVRAIRCVGASKAWVDEDLNEAAYSKAVRAFMEWSPARGWEPVDHSVAMHPATGSVRVADPAAVSTATAKLRSLEAVAPPRRACLARPARQGGVDRRTFPLHEKREADHGLDRTADYALHPQTVDAILRAFPGLDDAALRFSALPIPQWETGARIARVRPGMCPACRREHSSRGIYVHVRAVEGKPPQTRGPKRPTPWSIHVSLNCMVSGAHPVIVLTNVVYIAANLSEDELAAHPWFDLHCIRPMPTLLRIANPSPEVSWGARMLAGMAKEARCLRSALPEFLLFWKEGGALHAHIELCTDGPVPYWRRTWTHCSMAVLKEVLGEHSAEVLSEWTEDARVDVTLRETLPLGTPLPRHHLNTLNPMALPERAVAHLSLADATAELAELRWHLYWRICRGQHAIYVHLLRCMAHLVQRFGTRLQVCFAMTGEQGVGKGTVVQVLMDVLGSDNCFTEQRAEALNDRFNGHREGKVLGFYDEAVYSGDQRTAGAQLASVSERKVGAEHKYERRRFVTNCCSYFIASNNLLCVHVGAKDRRTVVLRVSPELAGLDRIDHKREVARAFGGTDDPVRRRAVAEALARVLHAVDLAGFTPQARAAGSLDQAADQLLSGLSPALAYLIAALRAHANDPPADPTRMPWDATEQHRQFQQRGGPRAAHVSEVQFQAELRPLLVMATPHAVDTDKTLRAVALRLDVSNEVVALGAGNLLPEAPAPGQPWEAVFRGLPADDSLSRAWYLPQCTALSAKVRLSRDAGITAPPPQRLAEEEPPTKRPRLAAVDEWVATQAHDASLAPVWDTVSVLSCRSTRSLVSDEQIAALAGWVLPHLGERGPLSCRSIYAAMPEEVRVAACVVSERSLGKRLAMIPAGLARSRAREGTVYSSCL